ncbi:MAG: alpha-glucosidase [Caldanaerobacter sp.]|uniref:glycoside hydrolase family 31 protein n=1 Tax=Caldanaerobacter sp. TaxID=2930036 RepID=UPI0024AC6F2D|nr:glycoside hydrolase family 31 protein [Caldanaerobacter sp.]MDI3519395.1 alpha-glucosidase [Caldanaerobacter sp.]
MLQRTVEGIVVRSEGKKLELRVITDKIVNIFVTDKEEKRRDTIAIEKKKYDIPDFNVEESKDKVLVLTKDLKVEIDKKTFFITFKDKDGDVINEDYGEGVKLGDSKVRCYKKLREDHFYGFGEKAGYLDKKGEKFEMWNTDEFMTHNQTTKLLYESYPFFIGMNKKHTYGIFLDNSFRSFFNMGEESEEYYYFGAYGGQMNYYFIYGNDIKEVVENYTYLTGRIELPPLWALGNQQSRYSYTPQEKVLEVAKTFREKDIPCDVIYLDIDYMEGYRVFTWNKDTFKNYKEMLKNLKSMGFKVVTIVDPGVKRDYEYFVYGEGIENDYFVKDKYGITYVGKVWPGEACFPDFLQDKVRKWWGEKIANFVRDGIDGIWNDMNEPAVFETPTKTMPEDNIHILDGEKISHREAHNVYANYMALATKEGLLKERTNERPFILTRAAFAGIQRYATMWTGDNRSLYEHLLMMMPMLMNVGLSGQPFAGADVGGFEGDCSEELFIRWIEAAVFTPFLRVHSAIGTKDQEPWSFGKKAEDIARKFIKIRYELLPYIYDLFYEASKKGYPVMRPLVFEYQEDENTHKIYDEFMLGQNLLIAPVYLPSKDRREVYLPSGIWYDYFMGERYEGGNYYLVEAPIDTIPVFVKEGAIIVKQKPLSYVEEDRIEEKVVEIYRGNRGRYVHYEDDGKTFDYKKGVYNLFEIEFEYFDGEIDIKFDKVHFGYEDGAKKYRFVLKNFDEVKKVKINGEEVEEYEIVVK